MRIVVHINYRDGKEAEQMFDRVEGALSLVCDLLRRWADNIVSVTISVRLLADALDF